jgi:hypothetical protein
MDFNAKIIYINQGAERQLVSIQINNITRSVLKIRKSIRLYNYSHGSMRGRSGIRLSMRIGRVGIYCLTPNKRIYIDW